MVAWRWEKTYYAAKYSPVVTAKSLVVVKLMLHVSMLVYGSVRR